MTQISEDGLWQWDGAGWVPVAWYAEVARANEALAAGAAVLQCSLDLSYIEPVVKIQSGAHAAERSWNPTRVLNQICALGWVLVDGSVVFIEHAEQIRERVMSGQTVGIQGVVRGYYLFSRRT